MVALIRSRSLEL